MITPTALVDCHLVLSLDHGENLPELGGNMVGVVVLRKCKDISIMVTN